MKPQINGVVLWQGASLIDGAPIVVIATGIAGKSKNAKTGDMVQTWIMRSDIAPHLAVKSGQDVSVCGDCNLRPSHYKARGKKRPCYVKTFQAPNWVYRSFHRGIYPTVSPDEGRRMLAGKKLRLGSYGNPSAAPIEMWREVSADCSGHTGYVHNWRTAPHAWSELVMASVETVLEGVEARKLGYRLFRVRDGNDALQPREISCPASKEAGFKTTCASCVACGGNSAKAKVDIAIMAH